MLETLRKTRALLGGDRLGKWALLVVLALVAAVFEAVGALVVFALLRRITTEQSGFELPLAGNVREILPGVGDTTLLVIVGVVVAGFFVARAALLVAQSYLQSRVTENASADLAARLVAGYLAMPYPFLLKRNSAELIRNTFDTVQQYARDALSPAVRLISQSLVALTLVAVLLAMSPWATLLAVGILGPFSWLLLRVIHPRVKRYGAISQEVSRQNLQTLDECLSGWRDIKILGRERFFAEQFAHDRRRLARIRYLSSTLREIPRVAIETGLVLFILAFLGVNALVNDGALEALPVLGLFGYVAVRLQPSLTEIMTALNSLKFVGPGIDLIYRDLLLFPAEAACGDPPGAAFSAARDPVRRRLDPIRRRPSRRPHRGGPDDPRRRVRRHRRADGRRQVDPRRRSARPPHADERPRHGRRSRHPRQREGVA